MNNRKTIIAGIGKLKQRLADPRPLSDAERKQVADFLDKIEAEVSTVRVSIEPESSLSMPIGPHVVRGLGFGCGFMIVASVAMFFMGFVGAVLSIAPSR